MSDLLTTGQVQEILQVDRTTIYRMVEDGRLAAVRVGKQWRFPRADFERWLEGQAAHPVPLGESAEPAGVLSPASPAGALPQLGSQFAGNARLADVLPVGCAQLVQDAFAEILGVMLVVADMRGEPVTQVSNAPGCFDVLMTSPTAQQLRAEDWRDLGAAAGVQIRFSPGRCGLLWCCGLIRCGSEVKGMVIAGGVAPDEWPPEPEQLATLAQLVNVDVELLASRVEAAHRLDQDGRERAAYWTQRVADIFAHMIQDRSALCGRLQAIAALTAF